jgi:hypothetical protein
MSGLIGSYGIVDRVDAAADVDTVSGAVFNALAVTPRLDGADWPSVADALISVVTKSNAHRRRTRTPRLTPASLRDGGM